MKLSQIHKLSTLEYEKIIHDNMKDILKMWKDNLNPTDKQVLKHFEKDCQVILYFEIFCCWKKNPFKNKKDLAISFAHFFKIYVALTSLRSAEADCDNFDYVYELPFKIERIARGEDPYGKMPQVLVRLKRSIDLADPQLMLIYYSQTEQKLLDKLSEKDTNEAINLLFSYGPAFLSFFIQNIGKAIFENSQSFSSGIIDSLEFHLKEMNLSRSVKRRDYYKFLGRFVDNYRKST